MEQTINNEIYNSPIEVFGCCQPLRMLQSSEAKKVIRKGENISEELKFSEEDCCRKTTESPPCPMLKKAWDMEETP